MDAFRLAAYQTTIVLAAIFAVIKLILAIRKTTWISVESSCCECVKHQAGKYKKRMRTRYILSGYQSSFMYYHNDEEYTGTQPWKYNPGQYTPGQQYVIKVNPHKPTQVATKVEIAWDYISVAICIGVIVTLLVS